MQQRDPDRVTPTGTRDRTMTGSGGLLVGLFVVGLLVLGYMMFWPSERTTNLSDSTPTERTAPTTTTTPPTNKPQTDLKPDTPPPAKAPAQ
jgi:hypothetical protein